MKNIAILSITLYASVACGIACDQSTGHTSEPPPADDGSSSQAADAGHGSGSAGRPAPPSTQGDAGAATETPAARSGNPPCALSVDCPSGQHCDLGECYQECNVSTPCAGSKVCSERGRCLAPGQADSDPPPVTAKLGTVHADTSTIPLTDRDDKLRVHLVSDAKDAVRYRIEVNAPYLSVDDPRGTFTGDVTLELGVNPAVAGGKDVSGSVRVITSLGNVLVTTPMKSSITGSFQGALTYDGVAGGPQMGSTRVGLDVSEDKGNVVARFAPERSLLFAPVGDSQPVVSGTGSFTYTDGADMVMRQVIPAGFAGDDDLFNRDIGREVRLRLTPGVRGSLDGTFTETLYGLLGSPLSLSGHAHFERVPCNGDAAACAIHVAPPVATAKMPAVDPETEPDFAAAFPGWALSNCTSAVSHPDPDALSVAAAEVDARYHQPFLDHLSGMWSLDTADPLGDLADACDASLKETTPDEKLSCAQIAPLACSLTMLDATDLGRAAYDAFGTLYAHTLDVPLFVAQNELVRAMKDSFVDGFRAELRGLDRAKAILHTPATWVLHPRLLEFLRRADPQYHSGPDEAPTSFAARTLSHFLLVRSTIDAEEARIQAGSNIGTEAARRRAAQQKGLEAFFEAATLYGVASSWKSVPPELGAAFVDVLTPMDAGFTAMTQKSQVLGVADGNIPNVYDPTRMGTNFEQLLDIAAARIQSAQQDETVFTNEGRQFEDDEEKLAEEVGQVVSGYETQLKGDCGDAFDFVKADFDTCGQNDSGTVGAKLVEIQSAFARMQSAQSRVEDKAQAVQIEQDRIDAIVGVKEGTITFTYMTGETLKGVDRAMAELDGL
ncbi:MAG TPA: hypothetical protein VHU80_22945, partial [Polyangiaceae bacterium]|nr:hypothetical protein [Polyangiaceae bacterium]